MSQRPLAVLILGLLLVSGCSLLPAGSSPTPSPLPSPSPSPTQAPSPTATPILSPTPTTQPSPAADFYLRGWYTQSIPPQYTFTWLSPFTVTDGTYINGNVAVPAIYPGPLMIVPVSRSISDEGIATIVAEATRLGLLGDQTDFTGGGPMPGAKLGELAIVVDGKTFELTGNPDLQIECIKAPCEGAPGSPEAFAAFWRDLTMLDTWLDKDLGESAQYTPERVALSLTETVGDQSSPLPTVPVAWPLDTPLADADCLTLEGDDLATMLPVLESATQLTVFTQGDITRQPQVRVLVPGEPSPCD